METFEAFKQVIFERESYKKLQMTQNAVSQLRWRVNNDKPVSIDQQRAILQLAGWKIATVETWKPSA